MSDGGVCRAAPGFAGSANKFKIIKSQLAKSNKPRHTPYVLENSIQ